MILVTGGTGLVGAHLLLTLVNNGEKVRAIHRVSSDLDAVKNVFSYDTCETQTLFNKIEWIIADITDVTTLEAAFKNIEYVYHCAAFISFNPRHYSVLKKVNIEGTANVVNFCLTEGVKKLCYVSSIATLGKTTDESFSTEETEFKPEEKNSVYAITKHEAEMQVWRGTQEGLDAIIVHPGVIIGEGIWNSASGGIFRTISKGLRYFTPGGVSIVDVKDVVKVMINLISSPIKNEAYILVAKNIYFKELLTKISDGLNKKPPNKTIAKWIMISFSGAQVLHGCSTVSPVR